MFSFSSDNFLQTKQYPEYILSSSYEALKKQYGADILQNVPFYPATQKENEGQENAAKCFREGV